MIMCRGKIISQILVIANLVGRKISDQFQKFRKCPFSKITILCFKRSSEVNWGHYEATLRRTNSFLHHKVSYNRFQFFCQNEHSKIDRIFVFQKQRKNEIHQTGPLQTHQLSVDRLLFFSLAGQKRLYPNFIWRKRSISQVSKIDRKLIGNFSSDQICYDEDLRYGVASKYNHSACRDWDASFGFIGISQVARNGPLFDDDLQPGPAYWGPPLPCGCNLN